MHPYRTENVVETLSNRPNRIEFTQLGRDRYQSRDPGPPCSRNNLCQVLSLPLQVIQMAVGIDEHQASSSGSVKRGNTPVGAGKAVPASNELSRCAKLR